jgi:hypothetical protein
MTNNTDDSLPADNTLLLVAMALKEAEGKNRLESLREHFSKLVGVDGTNARVLRIAQDVTIVSYIEGSRYLFVDGEFVQQVNGFNSNGHYRWFYTYGSQQRVYITLVLGNIIHETVGTMPPTLPIVVETP